MVHAARVDPAWMAGVADVADQVKGSMGLAKGAGLAMQVVVDRRVLAARCTADQMAHAAREAKAAARCVARDHGVTTAASATCAADRAAKDVAKDAARVGRTRLTGLARRVDRVDRVGLRGAAVGVAHARMVRCAVVPRAGRRCVARAMVALMARARRAVRKVAAAPKAGPSAVRARSLMARGTIADIFAASRSEN